MQTTTPYPGRKKKGEKTENKNTISSMNVTKTAKRDINWPIVLFAPTLFLSFVLEV